MKGNIHAANMLTLLYEASQMADDIVDEDAENPIEAMARVLSISFVEIPSNQFYIANMNKFIPLFATSIQIWSLSDEWGKSKNEEQQLFGYVYREVLEQCIIMAAYIVGWQKHAREVTREVNNYYHKTDQDKLADWLKEQNHG